MEPYACCNFGAPKIPFLLLLLLLQSSTPPIPPQGASHSLMSPAVGGRRRALPSPPFPSPPGSQKAGKFGRGATQAGQGKARSSKKKPRLWNKKKLRHSCGTSHVQKEMDRRCLFMHTAAKKDIFVQTLKKMFQLG